MMASLVPGFQYDIFVSYRHNDNLDGWVTTFVQSLERELKATVKESVSIYFDKNLHDGLQELHHVEKSLDGKLRCLIFIPIISQTYTDPSSYAWQHEFCAFNKRSADDPWTRDVRLANGNVGSRVLAVKIHDLDDRDRIIIEHELRSPLRAIEFIYKEPGVNRPLKENDTKVDNQNHTEYRNQINKVANAIKEIMQGILEFQSSPPQAKPPTDVSSVAAAKPMKKLMARALMAGVVLVAVSLSLWFLLRSKVAGPAAADNSLVVLTFKDLSHNGDQKWFCDGVTEELLNQLAAVPGLRLISRTTSFALSATDLPAKAIADSLRVSYILEGSIRKEEEMLKITVQLIRASDDSHIWSHAYDYKIDSIFKIQVDISRNVAQTLNLLLDPAVQERMSKLGTTNVDAYLQYLKGMELYGKAHQSDAFEHLIEANPYFERAIKLDPQFSQAYYVHADLYTHSLIGNENISSFGDLTEQERYSRMLADIGNALKYAKNRERQLGYGFGLAYLSQDWSQLPKYMNEEVTWYSGWDPVLCLINPAYVAEKYVKTLEADPLNNVYRAFAAWGFMGEEKYDSALALYANQPSGDWSILTRSIISFRKGNYDEALQIRLIEQLDSSYTYLLIKYMDNQWIGSDQQLVGKLRSMPTDINSKGESSIQLFNAIGDQGRADSVAHRIDSRLLGSVSLSNNVLLYGLHFHLNAAPNFTKCLVELGIDPVKYEKENFRSLRSLRPATQPSR